MKSKIVGLILLAFYLNLMAAVTIINQCETEGEKKCEMGNTIRTEPASFEDDYLYMGKGLNFSGETDDLIFMGESLDFSGKTRSGIIGFGKDLLLRGTAGNGIIAGGKGITIKGDITGTNFIGSKDLIISEHARLAGDLFAGCGDLTQNGRIDGNVYIGAGKITINNEINGDVKIYGGRMIITENGKINGNLTYGTKEKLSGQELARVSGSIEYKKNKDFEEAFDSPKEFFMALKFIFHLLFILSFVVVGSILLFLPVCRKMETGLTEKAFWRTALWGLIPIFMYPAVILLSFIMVITIPFALLLILAFVPLFFVAYIIGTTLAGQYLVMKFKWNVKKRHYHFLIGALAAILMSLIPVINFFAVMLLSGLGWGVYISLLFSRSLVAGKPAETETTETE
jgi:cytoskeletal protein CcmA (bactofilin family)